MEWKAFVASFLNYIKFTYSYICGKNFQHLRLKIILINKALINLALKSYFIPFLSAILKVEKHCMKLRTHIFYVLTDMFCNCT